MLRVDIYHNHPVLKAFVAVLWDTHCDTKEEEKQIHLDPKKGKNINHTQL